MRAIKFALLIGLLLSSSTAIVDAEEEWLIDVKQIEREARAELQRKIDASGNNKARKNVALKEYREGKDSRKNSAFWNWAKEGDDKLIGRIPRVDVFVTEILDDKTFVAKESQPNGGGRTRGEREGGSWIGQTLEQYAFSLTPEGKAQARKAKARDEQFASDSAQLRADAVDRASVSDRLSGRTPGMQGSASAMVAMRAGPGVPTDFQPVMFKGWKTASSKFKVGNWLKLPVSMVRIEYDSAGIRYIQLVEDEEEDK